MRDSACIAIRRVVSRKRCAPRGAGGCTVRAIDSDGLSDVAGFCSQRPK